MVVSSSPTRSITIAPPSSGLPRTVDAIVGSVLELVIHSIEGLRERFGRAWLR